MKLSEDARREGFLIGLLLAVTLIAGLLTHYGLVRASYPGGAPQPIIDDLIDLIDRSLWLKIYGFALFLIPLGIAIDRFGPLRVLGALICLVSVVPLINAVASSAIGDRVLYLISWLSSELLTLALPTAIFVALFFGVRRKFFGIFLFVLYLGSVPFLKGVPGNTFALFGCGVALALGLLLLNPRNPLPVSAFLLKRQRSAGSENPVKTRLIRSPNL